MRFTIAYNNHRYDKTWEIANKLLLCDIGLYVRIHTHTLHIDRTRSKRGGDKVKGKLSN